MSFHEDNEHDCHQALSHDTHGSSPFQDEVTSEPTATIEIVVRPTRAEGTWSVTKKDTRKSTVPPKWMAVSKHS
jgi:hypothetical protein